MTYTALIIDDEPLARMMIREYLADHPEIRVLAECGDGFEGLKAIQQHRPDLIFLDIQMPKINGFEMLDLLETPPAVIFTTAFDQYAIKAFENNAVDYLLKPFSKERFEQALQKRLPAPTSRLAESNLLAALPTMAHTQQIVVKTLDKIKIIPLADLWYAEAADDYVKLHTSEGVFLKNRTMTYLETSLDPHQFVRIHRSFLVQVRQVKGIDLLEKESYQVWLHNGARLPVSKSGYQRLRTLLNW